MEITPSPRWVECSFAGCLQGGSSPLCWAKELDRWDKVRRYLQKQNYIYIKYFIYHWFQRQGSTLYTSCLFVRLSWVWPLHFHPISTFFLKNRPKSKVPTRLFNGGHFWWWKKNKKQIQFKSEAWTAMQGVVAVQHMCFHIAQNKQGKNGEFRFTNGMRIRPKTDGTRGLKLVNLASTTKAKKETQKQTFAVEEQTDAATSEATCSRGFNVRHYFLIKLN